MVGSRKRGEEEVERRVNQYLQCMEKKKEGILIPNKLTRTFFKVSEMKVLCAYELISSQKTQIIKQKPQYKKWFISFKFLSHSSPQNKYRQMPVNWFFSRT